MPPRVLLLAWSRVGSHKSHHTDKPACFGSNRKTPPEESMQDCHACITGVSGSL